MRTRRVAWSVVVFLMAVSWLGWAQAITGPTQMTPLDVGTFTVTISNASTTQSACDIFVTNTVPNSQFSYVTGTSLLTLPDGRSFTLDPSVIGLDLFWDVDLITGESYQLPPGESLTIRFDLATSSGAYGGTDIVTLDYVDCSLPSIPFQSTDSLQIAVVSIDGCVDDVTGVTNNCTANDVRVSRLIVVDILDGCVSTDDTACVILQAELVAGAAERYDIGMFLSLIHI